MRHLIAQELAETPEDKWASAHEKWGRDDEFFVSRMIKHNRASAKVGLETPYLFASKEVSISYHFNTHDGAAALSVQ
jgi:hypothetical protein